MKYLKLTMPTIAVFAFLIFACKSSTKFEQADYLNIIKSMSDMLKKDAFLGIFELRLLEPTKDSIIEYKSFFKEEEKIKALSINCYYSRFSIKANFYNAVTGGTIEIFANKNMQDISTMTHIDESDNSNIQSMHEKYITIKTNNLFYRVTMDKNIENLVPFLFHIKFLIQDNYIKFLLDRMNRT